jgi:hypothetical protein
LGNAPQEFDWSPHEQALKALVSAAIRLQLARTLQCASPNAKNVPGDSERAGAQHDGNDVPFPAKHSEEHDRANDEGKPIHVSGWRKDNVNAEPNREV